VVYPGIHIGVVIHIVNGFDGARRFVVGIETPYLCSLPGHLKALIAWGTIYSLGLG
jgi:hypothetical protein